MVARMGREHTQETFETEKTALVVVDMQNYFMDESQQAGCPVGQTVVGNVNKIADTVRRTGGIVIWIQNMAPTDTRESWSTAHERYLPEKADLRVDSMQPGAPGRSNFGLTWTLRKTISAWSNAATARLFRAHPI